MSITVTTGGITTGKIATAQIETAPSPEHLSQAHKPFLRQLNAMDCTILAVHQALQSLGGPGFDTQAVIWLNDRVDPVALKSALVKLQAKYPGLSCCLANGDGRGGLHWQTFSNNDSPLQEKELGVSRHDEIWQQLSALLSQPRNLFTQRPLDFHLLHLADGRDLFVMQYNHTLMDNAAALSVLEEIDALFRSPAPAPEPSPVENGDFIADYLARIPSPNRLRAAWNTVKLRLVSLRGDIATLGDRDPTPVRLLPVQVATRTLDAAETRALAERVVDVCRFPGLSMPLLASLFRTLERFLADRPSLLRQNGGRRLTVGIGLDLGLRSESGPLFQNLSSVIPIVQPRGELASQDQLARGLVQQLRERLEQRIDLGVVQLASLLRRHPRILQFAMRRLMRSGYSAWYAYFGSADGLGDRFCGAPIDDFRFVGPCWPSVGLTLVAHQFRGRLLLQATYVPACVGETTAEAFMDALVANLRTWSNASE
jgi:hypothetical protein